MLVIAAFGDALAGHNASSAVNEMDFPVNNGWQRTTAPSVPCNSGFSPDYIHHNTYFSRCSFESGI